MHPSSFVLPVHVQPPPGKLIPSSLPLKTDHKQLCVSRVRLQGSVLHCPFALGFVYTLVLEPANSTALLHPSWALRAGSAGLLKNRRELSMLLGNQRSCPKQARSRGSSARCCLLGLRAPAALPGTAPAAGTPFVCSQGLSSPHCSPAAAT